MPRPRQGGTRVEEHSSQSNQPSASTQKILILLAGLQRHPAGSLIYEQVRRILLDSQQETQHVEVMYASLLGVLLDALAESTPGNDPMRLQIRLLQRRLRPPLLPGELRSLRRYLERWSSRLKEFSGSDTQAFRNALGPLLGDLGLGEPVSDEHDEAAASPAPESGPPTSTPMPEQEPETGPAERKVDSAYRHHLDEKNREVQELQSALSRKIQDTIRQHQQVGVSLEVALSELKRHEDAGDVERAKELIAGIAQQLLSGNRELTDKLDSTYHTLEKIADGSRRLSDELSRVRQLSLTDELTGLPNRRAFQRRLEDEIARANRYGYPLTLAVMDLDEFKQINDSYGHAIGDRILQEYATSILSIFRRLDMVARYGGEEFAVLLPNTDLHGAMRALHKVKARVPEVSVQTDAGRLATPTFSAGVSAYHPGETSEAFVSRTDAALYEAKRRGRNRVEAADEERPHANDSHLRQHTDF